MPSENDKTASIHPFKTTWYILNETKNINFKVIDLLNKTNQNGAWSKENLITSCFIPQRSSNYVGPEKNLCPGSTHFQRTFRHYLVEWIKEKAWKPVEWAPFFYFTHARSGMSYKMASVFLLFFGCSDFACKFVHAYLNCAFPVHSFGIYTSGYSPFW